jgi:predicted MFS family arabinose efflux permease
MPVRDRDLRIVAGAIAVSAIGDFVALIALALRTHDLWKSFGVAALFICLWSPLAVLAGHVGVLVDRVETRGLAIASACFQAVVAVALAFVHSVVPLLALTVVLGIGVAVSQAAEFALIPLLAGSRPVGRANGLVESARGLGFMIGPLIGGSLAAAAGTRTALLADAATFVIIGAALATLPVRRHNERSSGATFRARDGITLLFQERGLAIAMTVGAFTLVFMSASIPGDFAYVQDVLGVKNIGIGIVLTAWAIGMVAASNTIPQRIPVQGLAVVTMLAAMVQGLAKFVTPFWLVLPFMVCCYVIGGAGHGVKNAGFRTLIHQRVPPESHGRAFAAYNGLRNTAELVALAGGGLLVATVGGRGTLWIAGGASALAALVGVVALSRRSGSAVPVVD